MEKVNFKHLIEIKEKIDNNSPLITKDYTQICNLIDNLAKSSTFAHKAHKEIKAEYNRTETDYKQSQRVGRLPRLELDATPSFNVQKVRRLPNGIEITDLTPILWFESLTETHKIKITADLKSFSTPVYQGKHTSKSVYGYSVEVASIDYYHYFSFEDVRKLYKKSNPYYNG